MYILHTKNNDNGNWRAKNNNNNNHTEIHLKIVQMSEVVINYN